MIGRLYRWRDAIWILLIKAGPPFDRGPRRNVLLERVTQVGAHGLAPSTPGRQQWEDSDGNVWAGTGEQVCRPFRGLRCYQP